MDLCVDMYTPHVDMGEYMYMYEHDYVTRHVTRRVETCDMCIDMCISTRASACVGYVLRVRLGCQLFKMHMPVFQLVPSRRFVLDDLS